MDITDISIMHHVGIVLFLLWFLSVMNCCHPVIYFVSLIYLYLIHERYVMRLRRKMQYDERKQANQKRVLSDSETVRWLNHAVEKIWPICMEQITSQKILLPIIPWFLEKYKPWTAKEAVVQHMYLGRNPPMFTEMRVLRQSTGDDHLVLELGMNFCTADDMSAILAVKLRKRLGFGIWAKLHVTGMHVEGKVLVGVKFLRRWPFLGRLRVCFAEPPYFQMTVKPIFTHGLDVTELPGIAGWLDKLLSIAFEQTLIQPNMLVVDVEKFASPQTESWFSVDEKEPVAYVKVEVVEATDMKPSDLNGLADPYVKGQLGPYGFRTKIQRKTLAPKWHEEFKMPICSWELPNVLAIQVRDKDHFLDDTLGICTVNINDLRDGERHDMWLPLKNIKMGRLHLAVTVLDENEKGVDNSFDGQTLDKEEIQDSFVSETCNRASFSSVSPEKSSKMQDNFEPINIEGQQETGIWVHQPGSDVSQTWEPRKGKSRLLDNQIHKVLNDSFGSTYSGGSGPFNDDSSSSDENADGKNKRSRVRRGFHKISSVFHRNPKNEENLGTNGETVLSPYANIKAENQKGIGVKFIVEDSLSGPISNKDSKVVNISPEGSGSESPGKGNVKGMAKCILKQAEKSAQSIKHVLSRKGSRSRGELSAVTEQDISLEFDSSNDARLSSPEMTSAVSNPMSCSCGNDDSDKIKEATVIQTGSSAPARTPGGQGQTKKVNIEGLKRIDKDQIGSSSGNGSRSQEASAPQLSKQNLGRENK